MTTCTHCDEAAIRPLYGEDDVDKKHPFCCYGCLTVYHVIFQKGLEAYYDIKKNSALYKRRSPVEIKTDQFKFLDDADFLEQYSYESYSEGKTMEFYLEGIHCLACLWLIEKLPEFLDSVVSAKLNLEKSVVTVILRDSGSFSDVARELNNLGYRPHPLKRNEDSVKLKREEERAALIRIGVAGAAAGNIMIYAVSLYGGASGHFASLFNSLTVIFAIPVLSFSAFPFYRNAWHALKNRTLSIDIPISLALISGAAMGVYNLFQGIPENYFDSLTTLVFLLLLSRYFLQKIQEKGLSTQDLHYFYQNESVFKVDPENRGKVTEIHPKFIKKDDVLIIRPGEFIPSDGVILEGASNLNISLLTGESRPQKLSVGERVFQGTQNLDHEILMRVEKVQADTRLGQILKNVENGWAHRSQIVDLTSRVSKYFTFVVFILSAVLFIYLLQSSGMKYAFEQAITLLIVTCPCALALATPLTFTRTLSKASQQGIIIKNDEVIEIMSKVESIFLDKTGTITHGKLQVRDFKLLKEPKVRVEDIILTLEENSRHPVAKALLEFVQRENASTHHVDDLIEVLGRGVSGLIQQRLYEINKQGIFEDGVLVATFSIDDVIRSDSKEILRKLRLHRLKVHILSGDRADIVNRVASEVGLSSSESLSDLDPEEKSQLVKSTPHSMMVGDGANDAIALSYADVGVAVLGAMDISLRAADVYLTTPGLGSVEKLIVLSQETMKVIRRNLVLSLLYNSLSVMAVFFGLINPLIAAIIMPLSSLTVLLSTLIGTKKLRTLWK